MKRLLMALCLAAEVGCTAMSSADLTAQGHLSEAVVDDSTAFRRAQVRTELASAYLERGLPQAGLDESQRALRALPTHVPAQLTQALAHMAMGRENAAREALDEALRLAPDDMDALLIDAWWHCGQRHYVQAVQGFERARVQGAGGRAWLGQAVCTARSGGDADAAYARAYALAPRDPLVVQSWARYAQARGDWLRVHTLLTPFNASEQVSAVSLWLQAEAYRLQGERPQAKALAQRVWSGFPDSPQAASLKQEAGYE